MGGGAQHRPRPLPLGLSGRTSLVVSQSLAELGGYCFGSVSWAWQMRHLPLEAGTGGEKGVLFLWKIRFSRCGVGPRNQCFTKPQGIPTKGTLGGKRL